MNMLFIKKTHPKPSLTDWIKKSGRDFPAYESLQTANPRVDSYQAYTELREQLYEEQRGLCCYCMQRITKDNSNIEHFLRNEICRRGCLLYQKADRDIVTWPIKQKAIHRKVYQR